MDEKNWYSFVKTKNFVAEVEQLGIQLLSFLECDHRNEFPSLFIKGAPLRKMQRMVMGSLVLSKLRERQADHVAVELNTNCDSDGGAMEGNERSIAWASPQDLYLYVQLWFDPTIHEGRVLDFLIKVARFIRRSLGSVRLCEEVEVSLPWQLCNSDSSCKPIPTYTRPVNRQSKISNATKVNETFADDVNIKKKRPDIVIPDDSSIKEFSNVLTPSEVTLACNMTMDTTFDEGADNPNNEKDFTLVSFK
ncbi:hypothetical protein J437_LFUL010363 [Ladona fulva]|uniref:Uncharacterized protein n=1 Tax=Ladona fulva TaxID=123851 RepID=A0A8K0P5L2_LADFU|nr:hypothetical protein J437_LFUL010363 [Ladona fulva]